MGTISHDRCAYESVDDWSLSKAVYQKVSGSSGLATLLLYSGMYIFRSEPSTKVIYFTERTVTPFMSTIPRALGGVTLKDFKAMFDRPGHYRYHFKNYDPEYGMVKEEVRAVTLHW